MPRIFLILISALMLAAIPATAAAQGNSGLDAYEENVPGGGSGGGDTGDESGGTGGDSSGGPDTDGAPPTDPGDLAEGGTGGSSFGSGGGSGSGSGSGSGGGSAGGPGGGASTPITSLAKAEPRLGLPLAIVMGALASATEPAAGDGGSASTSDGGPSATLFIIVGAVIVAGIAAVGVRRIRGRSPAEVA